ncbi:hypothetical protein R3P38DRAFT_3209678 [Favolaschia claudopus]|uniref:Uncharacterized protein n=1 Tax=Favolaschia claudopus TaxID=2862362 RepID=A0AAW0AIP8_9AGAR
MSLSPPKGWLDIIYLACMITLLPYLDHRNYNSEMVPEFELEEAASVGDEYSEWREWVSEKYVCLNSAGETMNWEHSYRSAQASLLHMAVALTKYHATEAKKNSTAEIFQYFTPTAFRSRLLTALRSYDPALATQFTSKMKQMDVDGFFLFEGEELVWVEL